LKQDSLDFLVDVFRTQCAKGVSPKDVKFPSSLPVLRDAIVRGLVKMYDFFQTAEGRKIVQQVRINFELMGVTWPKCNRPGVNVRFCKQNGISLQDVCMGKHPRRLYKHFFVKTRHWQQKLQTVVEQPILPRSLGSIRLALLSGT
jgi:hypothetical protein